jgi:heat shock protein HspQ
LPKTTAKEINERREQVYFHMLRGENAQQIMKSLNLTQATVYRDIRFLGKRSKKYVYDIAKGDFLALAWQRSIDGIGYVMSEAWKKFTSEDTPEKQKPYYLRLIKDCQESIINQVTNGAAVLAVNGLRKRIEDAGINVNIDNFNLDADKYDSTHHNIMRQSGSN